MTRRFFRFLFSRPRLHIFWLVAADMPDDLTEG